MTPRAGSGEKRSGRRRSQASPPADRLRQPGRSIVLVAGVVLACAALAATSGGRGSLPDARGLESTIASGPAIGILPSVRPLPGHEVYAFVPYWEMDASIAGHVAAADVTTIGLFSVTHSTSGKLATGQSGYRRITGAVGRSIIAQAHGHHRRVEIAYTSFGTAKNARLFGDVALQDRVIAALAALRRNLDADGIAVDVEDIDSGDIPSFGGFIGRLRSALRADGDDASLTVATTAGPQGAALAGAANLSGADRIFLMGYDYRTAGSEPGASAPLARTDGGQRTLAWSLDLYAAVGIPSTRLLLGLPLYGVAWPVDSPDLGAPAAGKGVVWIPRQHLETLRDTSLQPVVDPVEQVAFLAVPDGLTWRAVYYDTPGTLAPKLALADERGLAGAGLWALGYDRGLPGYRELIATFRAGRVADLGTTPTTSTAP